MNITIIVLGILLVVLIYVLYLYLSPSYSSLLFSASLNTNNPPLTVIDNPTSPRYAYGMWLYVNSWNSTSGEKEILFRRNNIRLFLAANKLSLNLSLYDATGKWSKPPIVVTNDFPIQKWVYIVVSVDSNFVDCYLDGKLITSQKINENLMQPSDVGTIGSGNGYSPIILGGSDIAGTGVPTYTNYDAALNKFIRWSTPVNPQIVYDTYMGGNGTTKLGGLSSFNAKLDILKNNTTFSSFSIF